MIQFTKRNLLLYFRDRGAIFFSLLSVMIAFLLYVIVFRNLYGINAFIAGDVREITDLWAISGILAAPTVTTPLGALWVLVDDTKKKIYRDLYSSPISRKKIAGGYLISSFLIGIIMSCILLVVAQIYLIINGGIVFTPLQYLQILGTVIISTFSGAGFVLILVSLFPSNNAYTCFSLVIGTLVGFLTGNYVPMGLLPDSIQNIIKLSPVAHTSALLRQITVKEPMQKILTDADPEGIEHFINVMGIEMRFGEFTVQPWMHAAVLISTGFLFYFLAFLSLNRKRSK